jgi:Ion channel
MTWRNDLNYGLAAFGVRIPDGVSLDRWAPGLVGQPARNTAAVVAASSVVFYLAERNYNPKVADIFDAMVYCSTCLSVGYGDIFARTPVGKLIGALLMTAGPALSSQALDGSRDPAAERVQEQILQTLNAILEDLQKAD